MQKRVLLISLFIAFMMPCLMVQQEAVAQDRSSLWPQINSEQKAWTRWWWMGNAVTKEGITAQLELMAEANFGGVEISPIYGVEGYEEASVDYLSPEWMELLAHTVAEANRLGMKVDMITGTGWPFGGAHVTTEDAARRFVVQRYSLREGEQLPHLVQQVNRRMASKADLHILNAYSSEGEMQDLTGYVDQHGRLNWTPPSGSGAWQLIALFSDWTTQQVKRAAPGAEGHVMDHFSDRALANYLQPFDDAFENHDEGLIRAFFNDSYEVERANWTYDFFDRFEEYRGYDLRDYLHTFLGVGRATSGESGRTAGEMAQRIKADFHETIHDLALNRFLVPWRDWANAKGSLARNQAHGFPANILDIYGSSDIPEMEIFGQSQFRIPGLRTNQVVSHRTDSPNPLVLKFASSAAHVEGRPLVSSETATWLDEHFSVSLSQLRPHVDMQFIAGINHTIYHGSTYSPPGEAWPGWKFYASTHFSPSNTFWDDLGDFNRYMANSQAFLQKGEPGNDVLLYFPIHDLWHNDSRDPGSPYFIRVHNPNIWFYGTSLGDTAEILWDRGYAFDYISDRQLLNTATTADGKLDTGHAGYQTVVVPAAKYMPLQTMQHLVEIAREGGTVIFKNNLPGSVPGLNNLEVRQAALDELYGEINFRQAGAPGIAIADVGNGRILKGGNTDDLLSYAGISREPLVDTGLSYIRRNHADGRIYFLTNLYGESVDGWVPLAGDFRSVVIFDPLSETVGTAAIREAENGASEVYLQLKPGESLILETYRETAPEWQPWVYYQETGPSVPVEGTWQVNFTRGGPELPGDVETERLVSWTDFGDDEARRFAGTAVYSINIQHPGTDADGWCLNPGRVAESAVVRLNGEKIGSVWAHPFETDLPLEQFREGENLLEIEVSNLMINRIIDMDRRGIRWQKFYDINMVDIEYQPFDASRWAPAESGLLGPVRFVPLKKLDVN